MLLEQGAALAFGHASPDSELNPIVQGVGPAFRHHGAVPTDHRGFALRGAADEELVRIRLTTPGLRNPRNTGFCLFAVHNGGSGRTDGGLASGGLDT